MKKQLVVACVLILCIAIIIVILLCGNKMNSYIGNTYVGVTPWGNEVSVSVNGYDGSSFRFELKEGLSSNFEVKNEYEESLINENTLILHNSGEITENNESIRYEYSRKLKFVNGEIAVTYIDGKSVYESDGGKRIVHQVDALSKNRKTIILKLK